jgi:hypothetical protein
LIHDFDAAVVSIINIGNGGCVDEIDDIPLPPTLERQWGYYKSNYFDNELLEASHTHMKM